MRDVDGIELVPGQTAYVVHANEYTADIYIGTFTPKNFNGFITDESGKVYGCSPCTTFSNQTRAFTWYREAQEHAIENRNRRERDERK